MENKYILPTYNDIYDEYSFGSWLKRNVGNIAQTIGGVALLATGAGAAAGLPMIAGGIGGFGNSAVQADAEKQAEEDIEVNRTNMLAQQRLQGLTNTTNIPTMKKGGKLPEGNATLAEAKEYLKMFPQEMAMGEEVEYEHTGNKKLAQRIAADHIKDFLKMSGTPGYYTALKQSGISDELNKMKKGGYFEYKNGGAYIKPEYKAKYDKWIKKHSLGGKLRNIPNLSFFPDGGFMNSLDGDNMLTEYKGGGTHNENKFGGIPVGQKARVEEGEVRFDDDLTGESYIFSNRLPYGK